MPKQGPGSTLVLRQSGGFPGNADLAQGGPDTDLSSPSACFVMLLLIFPLETLTSLQRTWLVLHQACAHRLKAMSDHHFDSFSQHHWHK